MQDTAQDSPSLNTDAWLRWTLYVVTGFFAARLVFAVLVPLDLAHDEAYYWEWARRLDWCYYSKPPMVAWLIAVSTWAFGDNSLAVRLPAIVLGTWGVLFVYLLASDMFGPRAGFWAVCLSLAAPGSAALGLIMTIDAPLLFFWSATLYAFWQMSKRQPRSYYWLLLAIPAAGLGLLSKQTMLVFFPLAGLFLLSSPQERVELRRPTVWIWGIASLCFLAPVLWWNIQNDWVTLQHTSAHFSATPVTLLKRITRFLEFAGGQFGAASPVTCWLFLTIGIAGLASYRKCDRRFKFLLLFSILPILGTAALAFKQRVEPNWPAPIYVAGIVLVVGGIFESKHKFFTAKQPDRQLRLAFGTGLIATAITYLVGFGFGLEGSKLDPAVRLRGWQQLGEQVGDAFEQLPQANSSILLVANGRAYASELAFYMPQHPEAFVWNPSRQVRSQYDVWGDPWALTGHDALIVTTETHVPAKLTNRFIRVEPIDDVVVPVGAQRELAVHLWHGIALHGTVAAKQDSLGHHARGRFASIVPRNRR